MSGEAAEIIDKKIHELPKKGNKRMVQKEVLKSFIIAQQNLGNFNVLNPIDIRMEKNEILNVLQKHNTARKTIFPKSWDIMESSKRPSNIIFPSTF